MDKGMHPLLLLEGRNLISQELLRYNPYIHSGQDIQCSPTQLYTTHNWDPRRHKFWLSVEFSKVYAQKTSRQECNLSTSPRALTPHTEERWSKYYSPTVYPKKPFYINFDYIIMILYWKTNVKVPSPNEDTDYFDIVAGVLQGDTLTRYLFIICLAYVLRTSIDEMKDKLTKEISRR